MVSNGRGRRSALSTRRIGSSRIERLCSLSMIVRLSGLSIWLGLRMKNAKRICRRWQTFANRPERLRGPRGPHRARDNG